MDLINPHSCLGPGLVQRGGHPGCMADRPSAPTTRGIRGRRNGGIGGMALQPIHSHDIDEGELRCARSGPAARSDTTAPVQTRSSCHPTPGAEGGKGGPEGRSSSGRGGVSLHPRRLPKPFRHPISSLCVRTCGALADLPDNLCTDYCFFPCFTSVEPQCKFTKGCIIHSDREYAQIKQLLVSSLGLLCALTQFCICPSLVTTQGEIRPLWSQVTYRPVDCLRWVIGPCIS